MKEFFVELIATIKDNKENKKKAEFDENDTEENPYNNETNILTEKLEKEMQSENKEEFRIIGIIVLIVAVIVIILIAVFFIFKKSIANGMDSFINDMTIKMEKILDENDFFKEDKVINCQNFYTGIYNGEYTINNQVFKEKLSLSDNGTYSLTIDTASANGDYLLGNKIIALNDNTAGVPVNVSFSYQISDDCKTLTRTLNDGTTIVLNIE